MKAAAKPPAAPVLRRPAALLPGHLGGGLTGCLGALVGGRGAALAPPPLLARGRGKGKGRDSAAVASLGAAAVPMAGGVLAKPLPGGLPLGGPPGPGAALLHAYLRAAPGAAPAGVGGLGVPLPPLPTPAPPGSSGHQFPPVGVPGHCGGRWALAGHHAGASGPSPTHVARS